MGILKNVVVVLGHDIDGIVEDFDLWYIRFLRKYIISVREL